MRPWPRRLDIHDTHTSLRDRLSALGEALPELEPVGQSGAEALLGTSLTQGLGAKARRRLVGTRVGELACAAGPVKGDARSLDATGGQPGPQRARKAGNIRVLLEQAGRDRDAWNLAFRRFTERPDDRDARLAAGR